jgi:hypothetical protein
MIIVFIVVVLITYTFIFILWMMGLYALRVGVSTVFLSKVVEKEGINQYNNNLECIIKYI